MTQRIPPNDDERETGVSTANWPIASMLRDLSQAEGELDAAKAAAREAADHKKACETRVDERRSSIAALMLDAGVISERVNGTLITLKSGSPSLKIDDQDAIPDEFFETEPKLRADRVKARLMSGAAVAGARIEIGQPIISIQWSQK